VILLLPLVGVFPEPSAGLRVAAYALVLGPLVLLLYGVLLVSGGYATSRLLMVGAVAAAVGLLASFVARTDYLYGEPGLLVLLALCVGDLAKILAAACVGISLARYVTSVGVILIVVVAAVASDVFSVFAGPTGALVREDSPLLDFLLLVFPTFGSALGFGLGVSDFIFLALFAAAGRFLNLRPTATLLGVCCAAFLAVTAGLLLARPLPALPFIAVAFVLVNLDLILASFVKRG